MGRFVVQKFAGLEFQLRRNLPNRVSNRHVLKADSDS